MSGKKKHTNEQLIALLQAKAVELGRTPTVLDMGILSDMPGSHAFDVFGSWNAALLAAGLKPNRANQKTADLVEQLQTYYKTHNSLPPCTSWRQSGLPASSTLAAHFGSVRAALKAAGIPLRKKMKQTEQHRARISEALKMKDIYAASERAWAQGML